MVDARMDVVGVFGYSDEDGTEAESYDGKLDEDEIRERTEHVTRLVEELTSQRAEERIGEPVEVLLEDVEAAEGRAAHQGPEVDGTTTVTGAGPGRPGRRHHQRRRHRVRRCGPRGRGGHVTGPAPPPESTPSNWNLPNALTTLRIVMVPFFGWALLVDGGESVLWRCVAWVLFGLAMITDKIDGDIARSRNLITNFGKIADPIADKALTGMAFVGLSILGRALVVGDDPGARARVGDHPPAGSG